MKITPNVLLVEDEPRMRELLTRAVSSWGLPATAARSGEEALRLLQGEPFQVVVLDLNLPAMSGMEVFEQVRQRWPDIEVIILTGFGDLEAAKKAIHLDVVEFLTKPCHLGELEQAMDRARLRLEAKFPVPEIELGPEEEEEEAPAPPATPGSTLEDIERQHILAALVRNQGNRAATANELGISLRTLYYRLNEYQKQGHRVD